MKKYSVIIPVYNVEAYLPKCIDSVLNQDTSSGFEVILVDDGSPDGSGVICDAYDCQDSRVRVIHQENKGIGGARNTGLAAAVGDYVIYLDSDDYWEPNLLSTLDGMLENRPDMALFNYTRVNEIGAKMPYTISALPSGESGEEYLRMLFSKNAMPIPFVWIYAYRREFLLANQIFFNEDLRLSEDYEYNMRALSLAQSIVGTQKNLYNYVIREGSLTASMSKKKIMDGLNCKLAVFRQYPVAALANDYTWFVLMTAKWFGNDRAEILELIKRNSDVISYVSQPTLKVAQKLIQLLGFTMGIKFFWLLAEIKKKLSRSPN